MTKPRFGKGWPSGSSKISCARKRIFPNIARPIILNSSNTNRTAALSFFARARKRSECLPFVGPQKPTGTPKTLWIVAAPNFIWKDAQPVGAANTQASSPACSAAFSRSASSMLSPSSSSILFARAISLTACTKDRTVRDFPVPAVPVKNMRKGSSRAGAEPCCCCFPRALRSRS